MPDPYAPTPLMLPVLPEALLQRHFKPLRVPLLPENAQSLEVMLRHYNSAKTHGLSFTGPLWDRAKEWTAMGRIRLDLRKRPPLSFD